MRISPLSRNVIHDPVLWVAVIIYLVMIGWLSIARYMGFNAGVLDLGTMYQAIASTLRGEPLIVTSPQGNVSRLAGHFELIYYAFAPLIALWPDPRVLLIGQTLLAASGAFPAYAIALRRLDSVLAARSIVLIYLLYPVALTAVLFDFHGDTLAMPMILWLVDALERRSSGQRLSGRVCASCVKCMLLSLWQQ
jgi:Predicted membrane protein